MGVENKHSIATKNMQIALKEVKKIAHQIQKKSTKYLTVEGGGGIMGVDQHTSLYWKKASELKERFGQQWMDK